ncbi:MAG: hypothetical protein ACIALR_16830, partial [Blastopirellula sp. JB062]
GRELDHLPTVDEIQREFPNDCGYDTGMEDGMISAGVMMSLIVDKYAVTGDEKLRRRAEDAFAGIKLCTTAHGAPGFVARAVSADDLKSVYPCSSRDQYTHAVHGMWLFARSPLCSPEMRKEVGQVLSAVADRMTATVTKANNYDTLRVDGVRGTRGNSRMWNVKGHEAARLPMIYAAAWDVTGNREYYDLYQKYLRPAIEQSRTIEDHTPTYSFLQVQASLELLYAVEQDPNLKRQLKEISADIAARAANRARGAHQRAPALDLTMLCTDWRTGEGLSSEGRYRPVWYCIRESGEGALAQLSSPHEKLPAEQQRYLADSILRLDSEKVSSCGIFYLQAAYWKYLRQLQEDE